MRHPSSRTPLLFLLLLGAACASTPSSPIAGLEAASRTGAGAGARDQSLAGYHALYVAGDARLAKERFDAALARDASAPLAHLGHLLLAERDVRPDRQLDAALALVRHAPKHPASVLAARQLLELTGQVTVWDERLRQELPAVLQKDLLLETRVLLESALAELDQTRLDLPALTQRLTALGVARDLTVVGPLSAFSWLDTDAGAQALTTGSLGGPFNGPFGPVAPRALRFPDGRVHLEDEGTSGDQYLLAVDADVPAGGVWAVRVASPSAFALWVDGTQVSSRRPELRAQSMIRSVGVRLEPGRHRLILKLSRARGGGAVSLALTPAEGQPPATLTAATGDAPRWSGVKVAPLDTLFPDAQSVYAALLPDAGEALARILGAWDAQGRDHDGATALLAPLDEVLGAPAFLALRAEVALRDRTIPSKVAQGRAMRDLERALAADPGSAAVRLRLSSLALSQERTVDARDLLEPALTDAPGFPLVLAQAQIANAMGVDVQAGALAQEALEAQPGICHALVMRYDLARKRDAVAEADALLAGPLSTCPQQAFRLTTHASLRGRPEEALEPLAKLTALSPTSVMVANQRARIAEAMDRNGEAIAALEPLLSVWPRNASLRRALADVKERAGRTDEALALREAALLLDGSDLSQRRAVERARTGKELLQDQAIDALVALKAYNARRHTESTEVALVLDAAAVRAYPDGSQVTRIHTVQKVLTQGGVSTAAEVSLPPGAQVLALRTIKPDGRILEPEAIEGKDSVSLPNVEVGDSVDVEYLLAEGARDPSMPGFTAAGFYFQLLGQPNHWTVYEVLAPASMNLQVETSHLDPAPRVKVEGDTARFFHEQRDVPPLLGEPNRPADAAEYLPMATAGAGDAGQEALIAFFADGTFSRGALTFEVERFAREAVGGAKGLDAVKAIHAAVAKRLTGNDAGMSMSASASLAQDRGSRLWATKAALEAAGFPTRLVAVKAFNAAPRSSRFPDPSALGYIGLRVSVPGQSEPVWLDTQVRFGPFGRLPEAASGMPGWLMPEPGRPAEALTTPAPVAETSKTIELDLELDAQGVLRGKGVETYHGFDGAGLSESLARIPADRRRQGVEQALSRYFGGMRVEKLELDLVEAPGAPLQMRYTFVADSAARVDRGQLSLSALTFPAELGQRFVQVGKRALPLFIGESEDSRTVVRLKLPAGYSPGSLLPPMDEKSRFGRYTRKESLDEGTLRIEESLRVERGRIPPAEYGAFSGWAGSVDLTQSRDFTLRKQ